MARNRRLRRAQSAAVARQRRCATIDRNVDEAESALFDLRAAVARRLDLRVRRAVARRADCAKSAIVAGRRKLAARLELAVTADKRARAVRAGGAVAEDARRRCRKLARVARHADAENLALPGGRVKPRSALAGAEITRQQCAQHQPPAPVRMGKETLKRPRTGCPQC